MFWLLNFQTKEEKERLKYLEFVQAAAVEALLRFALIYAKAKDKSGPLKPGVESVEGAVKTVVGPVYEKYHDVPVEVLKYMDQKVIWHLPIFGYRWKCVVYILDEWMCVFEIQNFVWFQPFFSVVLEVCGALEFWSYYLLLSVLIL